MTWPGPRVPISQWLADFGVEHDMLDRPGWGTPNRPTSSGITTLEYTPDFGVTHYPVGIDDTGIDSILNLVCCVGSSAAPWPIYQAYIDHGTARITVVTEGRANHAGKGNSGQRSRAIADLPPLPPPDFDDMSGNRWSIGVTLEGPPTTAAQFEAAAWFWAAVCAGAGWTPNRVLGHSEWTARKQDPDFDMALLRGRTAEILEDQMAQFTDVEAAELRKLLTRHNDRFILGEVVDEVVAQDSSGKGIVTAVLTMWRTKPWEAADRALTEALADHLDGHPTTDGVIRRGDQVTLT